MNDFKNTFYIKRCEYWGYFMNLSDFRGIFYPDNNLSVADKKKLLKKLICVVNLELSTYCNRRCSYCPLSLTHIFTTAGVHAKEPF